jgi:hypothetical protein
MIVNFIFRLTSWLQIHNSGLLSLIMNLLEDNNVVKMAYVLRNKTFLRVLLE